jgi:MoxR-like ATPase
MLRNKMLAVMAEVSSEMVERDEVVQYIAIALLTRKNLFLLGQTGQAKSFAINAFRARITGARQFERLISKQTDEEQIFGRIDLGSLIPGSMSTHELAKSKEYREARAQIEKAFDDLSKNPESSEAYKKLCGSTEKAEAVRKALYELSGQTPSVVTAGKIPESEIVFLDEIFKANDGILNSLLTVLNERRYTNEGITYDIPVISFFAAGNEVPDFNDPHEKILRPLYDRFELKLVTDYVKDRQNRLSMLYKKQNAGAAAASFTTFTLDELYAMQQEVEKVIIPDPGNELFDDVLLELRKRGVHISDRKYFNYSPVVKAQAWLQNCGRAEPEHLKILKNYLWDIPGEIETVCRTLDNICTNPLADKISDIMSMAAETYKQVMEADLDQKKSVLKFRKEMLRAYDLLAGLMPKAVTEKDKRNIEDATGKMEEMSRRAHQKFGFTYAPLEELKTLQ